jgi:hypothetical protein
MTVLPPQGAIDKILAATTRLIRRIEIYEHDGVTPFAGGAHDWRLMGGQVTVDYNRDERRALELQLDNTDGGLSNSPGSIWYDKVIKVFHGVEISDPDVPVNTTVYIPKVLIIENIFTGGTDQEALFRTILNSAGYTDITTNLSANSLGAFAGYDIIVSLCNQYDSEKGELLQSAFDAGWSIFTTGNDSSAADFPRLIKTTERVPNVGSPTNAWTMAPNPAYAHLDLLQGWSAYTGFSTDTDGFYITAIPSYVIPVSKTIQTTENGSKTVYNIVAMGNGRGGFWIHMQDFYLTPTQAQNFVRKAMNYLQPLVVQQEVYNGQIGEFDIDRITESHFPHTINIQGRDYTKRCINSKFTAAVNIEVGINPEEVISNLAANSGITKFLVDWAGTETGRDFFYEAGVERWTAMKEIATAYNYELYFNAQGYLVVRRFQDPVTATPLATLKTHASDAGLITYEKSTNDSRLFNSVSVVGESADTAPVNAVAKNTVSGSPTSIAEIGERVYVYSSPLITGTDQAQQLADSLLQVMSLEEFDLNFTHIVLSWLDAGEVVQFTDPDPAPGDPTKFLLTQFEIPLTLGAMSGVARRVTIVS